MNQHCRQSLSVTMPAYNEENNIERMIERTVHAVKEIIDDYEIIVVNDGSMDRTAFIVQDLSKKYPQLRLVNHPTNRGYGAAVWTGFKSAQKDLIFLTDSDNQFVLEELAKLLPLLQRADLATGYRSPRKDPFHRVLFGKGWSLVVNLFLGYSVRDVDCAFKVFRRGAVDSIDIRSHGATFSAELLARMKRMGYRFAECPVTHLPRTQGAPTGAKLSVIIKAFIELVQLRWRLWREWTVYSQRVNVLEQ
ncbi:MAG: glycosyltransferase family 2 protein [Desulfobacteraceae bacterium]